LWARDQTLSDRMAQARTNDAYLPGVLLPPTLQPTSTLADAVSDAEFVVMAVPSHGLRAVAREAGPFVPAGCTLVSAAKGLEAGSLLRMSEVMRRNIRRTAPSWCCRDRASPSSWRANCPPPWSPRASRLPRSR